MTGSRFKYNVAAGRYVGPDGRFVSFATVRNALDAALDRSEADMLRISGQLQRGEIGLADWQNGMAKALKDIHLASGASAKGGWAQMSQSDYGRIGNILRNQYGYLNRFAKELETKSVFDGNFLRRVKMYAQSGRITHHALLRSEMALRGKEEERSVLAVADHCSECVEEAGKGWSPIGSLKLIGNRICRTNCRCHMEYK